MGSQTSIPVRRNFQQKLRAELDSRGWGIRTLARVMAEQKNEPHRVESLRRQLKRYLNSTNPVVPSVSTRNDIEDALALDRDALKADDDEEESELTALLMAAVVALRPLIRHEISAAQAGSGS